ncbi:MAG TPA: response regulator [Candidatus Melainabacteria bacterium]|nr:response regulator [Candidatus Melainabacteria bacterium]HIN67026.1 response regulator [Candidatus Obscuribacterales bacterium]
MPVLLVVEADPAQREIISSLLEIFEYSAVFVNSAEEALSAVRGSPASFDAILMDLRLPQSRELETAKAIRQVERERGRKTPLIAVSPSASERDRMDAIGAAADDCLDKPFDPEDLRRVLLKWTYNPARPNLRILPPSRSLESA